MQIAIVIVALPAWLPFDEDDFTHGGIMAWILTTTLTSCSILDSTLPMDVLQVVSNVQNIHNILEKT